MVGDTQKQRRRKKDGSHRAIVTNVFLVLMIMVTSVSMVSAYSWNSSIETNLISYWGMTNTTNTHIPDISNGEVNITTVFAGGFPLQVPGIIGNAQYKTDEGSDAILNVTTNIDLIRNMNRNFSIVFWVNMTYCDAGGNTQGMFSVEDGWALGFQGTGAGTECQLMFYDYSDVQGKTTNLNLSDGEWHQVGATVHTDGTLKLYVDGILNTSDSVVGAINSNKRVGFFDFGGAELEYAYDEVGFWNRTLTDSDITQLYNSGLGITPEDEFVKLISPTDGSSIINSNAIFQVNSTSLAGDNLVNTTLYVWNVSNQELTNYTTISGTTNITNLRLNLGIGDYTWNQYSCSDAVECSWSLFNKTFSIVSLIENSEIYSTTVQETSNQSFQINITYDNSIYPVITANLIYNHTSYAGTQIGTGNTILFNTSVIAPDVTGSSNTPFYWAFELNDGSTITYANSTFHNQTVTTISAINITTSTCAAGMFEAVNYTFNGAENLTTLTNMTIKYNFNYGVGGNDSEEIYGQVNNTDVLRICINETVDTYEIGYGELDYQQDGYVERRYYMFDGHSLSNETGEEFILYDLPTTDSTSFIFEIKNTFLNPYTDKYIGLLRWYPDLNEYKTVEMALTDEDGKTVMKAHTEDVDYRVGVYEKDGTLIKLADPVRMACLVNPCTYTLRIVSDEQDYTEVFDIETSLTFSEVTNKFTFTWNDPSQNTVEMRLLVTKDLGFQDSVVCNVTSSGSTGVLVCDIGNATGNFKAVGYRTASPETPLISKLWEVRSRLNNSWGLFISFILMLVIGLVGIFSPVGAIVMLVLGAIPAFLLGSINWVILMGIGVLGGLIIHTIKRT